MHIYAGQGLHGTAIGQGLYGTATEDTDHMAHLKDGDCTAQLGRTQNLLYIYVGWGLYGTATGDVAHTAQPHRTGTAWHSYRAVTGG